VKTTKTKSKQVSEANEIERRKEIDEFLLESHAATVKSRRLIEEYLAQRKPPPEDTFE